MTFQPKPSRPAERHSLNVKIGNTSETLQSISAAITERICEISRHEGPNPLSDPEIRKLAEKEILQPLAACGILESKDEADISLFSSALGAKDLEEIEVCAEPHRLILVGKTGPSSGSHVARTVYRVLPLAEDFDPTSVKLTSKQHGALIEIEIHKQGKKSLNVPRAA
jgi:hypothetical protein